MSAEWMKPSTLTSENSCHVMPCPIKIKFSGFLPEMYIHLSKELDSFPLVQQEGIQVTHLHRLIFRPYTVNSPPPHPPPPHSSSACGKHSADLHTHSTLQDAAVLWELLLLGNGSACSMKS